MSVTITSNAGTSSEPVTVLPVALTAPGRAKVHPIIGETDPAVTYSAPQLRSGELSYLFDDETAAAASLAMHAADRWFDVQVVSSPLTLSMRYIVRDVSSARLEQQPGNRSWLLIVPVQEVSS